jgi:hypothetical protein
VFSISVLYLKDYYIEPAFVTTLLNMITTWQNKTFEDARCKHESDVRAVWNTRLLGALAEAAALRFVSRESRERHI